MLLRSNNGFTLVELLVVISIMGILAAALTTQITKARSMGQAIRCKANMKNLAQAAMSYSVDAGNNHLPWAGSNEGAWPDTGCDGQLRNYFHLRKGWVSWIGGGPWLQKCPDGKWRPSARSTLPGTPPSFWREYKDRKTDSKKVYYSLTNGVLWTYLGRDLGTYVCPVHKKVAQRNEMEDVLRSYVMNCYFGYDDRLGRGGASSNKEIGLDSLSTRGNAGDLLLFAELPAFKPGDEKWTEIQKGGTAKAEDQTLQMRIINYNTAVTLTEEYIGFNHQVGKRYAAHVAYADGHVDVVVAPQSPSEKNLQNLTFFLCNGADVPADSSTWEGERAKYK